MACGTNCRATTIFPAWLYLPKKKCPSAFGGQRHLRFIKQERKALYMGLLSAGRLNSYLADINAQAEERVILLTEQMAAREDVTEQLKAQDQMLWVQRMNSIQNRAEEIVLNELIYC